MHDREDTDVIYDVFELRDSDEENDDKPLAAKRNRLEPINKSEDNKTFELVKSE